MSIYPLLPFCIYMVRRRDICSLLLALLLCLTLSYPFLSQFLRRNKEAGHYQLPSHFTSQSHVSLDHFCHTDPGIQVLKHNGRRKSRHKTCYGNCKNKTLITIHTTAVEAPRISTLCILNPFHGFYDCLWPLIHYLLSCRTDKPPIIVKTSTIPKARRKSWVVLAQQLFLHHSSVTNSVVDIGLFKQKQCVCYTNITKFDKHILWRPIRYQYQQRFHNTTVTAQHPAMLKHAALQYFRKTILSHYLLNALPPGPLAPILIYSRRDAGSRVWINVEDFVNRLAHILSNTVPLKLIHEIPDSFHQQIRLHNQARAIIAPHGAAMANTLFMRQTSVVLEITSRHCLQPSENSSSFHMQSVMNASDPNAWVPWHAESLGLYHLSAPCTYTSQSGRNFITDNDSLTRLAVLSLSLSLRTVQRFL